MATAKRKTLESWIADAMLDTVDDHPCTMIALVHMTGQQQKEIHTTKFIGGKRIEAKDLGPMFRSKAEAYCQDLPGVQTFQLMAFYGTSTAASFQPFTVMPPADTSGLMTEAPNEQGRTQQTMRHYEMLFQQTYRKQQTIDEHMLRLLEIQGNMLAGAMGQNQEFFIAMKDMLMEKALEGHTHAMKQLEYERTTNERKKLIGYLPVLANTITGKEIFPQSTSDTALFESIVENIDPKDLGTLAGIVKPELLGPLMSRLEQIQKKKNDEADARTAALKSRGNINPLLDAGGQTQDSKEGAE